MRCQKCMAVQIISIQIQDVPPLLYNVRQNKKKRLNEVLNQTEKGLTQLGKAFFTIQQEFNQGINRIIKTIQDAKNEMITNTKNELDLLSIPIQQMTKTQVEEQLQELKESSINIYLEQEKKIRSSSITLQKELVKLLNVKESDSKSISDKIKKKIKILKIENKNIIQDQIQVKLGSYEPIFARNSMGNCCAIAMDRDEKTLVNGSNSDIQVHKFTDDGSFTIKQTLKGHTKLVRCLCFSKASQWFISGSNDSTIRIWKEEHNENWSQLQVLVRHQFNVTSIVLNKDEDQFLSSSLDRTIRVWMKQINDDLWELKQTLTEHTYQVEFLSLSPDSTLLASCRIDNLRIWQQGNDKMWKEKQVLEEPQNDFYDRVCFIGSNELLLTTPKQGMLYRLISNNQGLFVVRSQLALNENKDQYRMAFPAFYNKQLQIAICKYSSSLTYILIKQTDGELTIHQELKGNYVTGCLSNNGQYLILVAHSVNNKKYPIEVWKLK